MTDFLVGLLVIIAFMSIGIIIGCEIEGTYANEKYLERSIELEYAHYDSKTSEVIWDNEQIKYILFKK